MLALASCGRIGFDPTACTLDVVLDADIPRDVTLCPGITTFVVAAGEGSRIDVSLELVEVRQASVELRSPDEFYLDGPTWRPASIESSALVTISGEQRIRIEADAELAARLTARITPPIGRVLHLAVDGSDAADGSEATPWQSWPFALGQLAPGDTLVAHDGTWDERVTGQAAVVTCGVDARSGVPGAPIIVVARHQRRAHLIGDGTNETFRLDGCDSWIVDGLHVTNVDFGTAGNGGNVIGFYNTPRLIARNLLVDHPNRCGNDYGLFVASPTTIDAVVEDCEIYDFHRVGVILYDTTGVMVRRVYAHSRNAQEQPCYDEPAPNDVRGDEGVLCYSFTTDTTCAVDNALVENVASGIVDSDSRALRVGGSIARDAYFGFFASSQQTIPIVRTSPIVIEDLVSIGSDMGIWNRGIQLEVTRATVVDSRARIDVAYGKGAVADGAGGTTGTTMFRDVLAIGNEASGFWIREQTNVLIDHGNAFGNPLNYDVAPEPIDDTAGFVQGSLAVEPTQLGGAGCLVYAPASSNMATAGSGGGALGAQIVYQLQNGVATDRKLWNQRTGAFPCGAIVPGVNDVAGESCFDAHERVRVGVSGCPIP